MYYHKYMHINGARHDWKKRVVLSAARRISLDPRQVRAMSLAGDRTAVRMRPLAKVLASHGLH